jgi:hypothetical protein
MAGRTYHPESKANCHKLTDLEEDTIVRYILDLDSRGFAPRLASIKDIANLLLESRGVLRVGKNYIYRFIQRRLELKTCFNRVYNFQKALCEDLELISAWFRLVDNMQTKYSIINSDFYNFDKTGFMIGIISLVIVVTRADRYSKGKAV